MIPYLLDWFINIAMSMSKGLSFGKLGGVIFEHAEEIAVGGEAAIRPRRVNWDTSRRRKLLS